MSSIPTAITYPTTLDTDANLFVVHDSLRLQLAEDYLPGDTSITVVDNAAIMDEFPATGLITLTDQCSDVKLRAISFYYASHTETTFDGLQILSGFTDVAKPKGATDVTQNVMAQHHNHLKNALIAIENFVGIKGETDTNAYGPTLVGRCNYLSKLIFTPRAFFSVNTNIGLAPLSVEFQQNCFRLGPGDVTFLWDFGDETVSTISTDISYIQTTTVVPTTSVNVQVFQDSTGPLLKTYEKPGIYDVKLTVTNQFGSDSVEFKQLINVRSEAPAEAEINIVPRSSQLATAGDTTPSFSRLGTAPGGPWTIPPTIRSPINTFIDFEVPSGNMNSEYSYAGEELDAYGNPVDPITTFTWSLEDDLTHSSSRSARASYSVGGIYDIKLRVDTEFGSYRITTYENCVDIIERSNLWLFTLASNNLATANEYGLISETFKVATKTQLVTRNSSFLNNIGTFDSATNTYPASIRGIAEFNRNTGFAPMSTTPSGQGGNVLLAWASGGSSPTSLNTQTVNSVQYQPFADIYSVSGLSINRPWNWAFFSAPNAAYFVFGPYPTPVPNTNLTDQVQTMVNFSPSLTVSNTTLNNGNYLNGASELQENVTSGYTGGQPNDGRFATYRTAWKDSTGYMLRNSGAGTFFRISSFYSTQGTVSNPFINITKLADMTGPTKLEGQLVNLSDGLYFFNNSGSISVYNDSSATWTTGGPSSASATFRSVQDSTVADFDDQTNTLLATSDSDHAAYLSFDYSSNAFIKFNSADLTFTNQGSRPVGDQWIMGIF